MESLFIVIDVDANNFEGHIFYRFQIPSGSFPMSDVFRSIAMTDDVPQVAGLALREVTCTQAETGKHR